MYFEDSSISHSMYLGICYRHLHIHTDNPNSCNLVLYEILPQQTSQYNFYPGDTGNLRMRSHQVHNQHLNKIGYDSLEAWRGTSTLWNNSYLWGFIFLDCQNSAGSWITGLFALHYRTIHYLVKPLWGREFVGKSNPRNQRTLILHEQCWFYRRYIYSFLKIHMIIHKS